MTPERLQELVEIDENGCWLWTRSKTYGYGVFRENKILHRAHRWSYEHYVRPLQPKEEIDHLCRVRHCVNPTHLEAVDHRTNQRRGMGPPGINARKTHCIHGHEFTPENTHIRKTGKRNCRTCAREAWRQKHWPSYGTKPR